MSQNWRYQEEENAVSPIIGVMLMIVITIVLAACIAMFSFSFADSTPKMNDVAVKVDRVDSSHIVVKFMGCMKNQNILFDHPSTPNGNYGETPTGAYGSFNVSIGGTEISNFVPLGTPYCTSSIGSAQYFSPVPPKSDVTVVANFKDGTKSVVWEGII